MHPNNNNQNIQAEGKGGWQIDMTCWKLSRTRHGRVPRREINAKHLYL